MSRRRKRRHGADPNARIPMPGQDPDDDSDSAMWRALRMERQEARDHRVDDRQVELTALRAEGFTVVQHTDWHFKINGRLNIWPSHNKFHDTVSGQHGRIRGRTLTRFVRDFFKQP